MNANRFLNLSRFVLAAGLVATAASAHAGGGVYWSVNVNTPVPGVGVSTSISNTRHGVYAPAQVVYAPPVYVQPAPVYVEPRPVYVQPRPVYYAPVVTYEPRCEPRGPWGWRHHHHDGRYAWNDDGGWRGEERMLPAPRDEGGWRRGH